jgi:tripeptidyl-peptidase-1
MFVDKNSYALIYPQTVTLYQVDDQIYEPEEVATTNLFNTFLDALDGVSHASCTCNS